MKTIIKLLLIFATSFAMAQSQSDVKTLDKGIFKIEYSEYYRSPLKVTYTLYHQKSVVNRVGAFYKEPGLITTTGKDYDHNVYDKGHMAPAETFSDSEAHMHATFTYANCALQHFELNRGLWKVLEMLERKISQHDSISVVNVVLFKKPLKKLPSGATVPSGFRKEITFIKEHKTRIFEFPNDETTKSIYDYCVNCTASEKKDECFYCDDIPK